MNSTQLESYLTGLILGDGYIDKGVTSRAFYLKTINKEWAERVYLDLERTTNFKVFFTEKSEYVGTDGVNHRACFIVNTKAHPYFNKKYHWFYNDYKQRVIYSEVLDRLDWSGWANWFMSDGYIVRVGLESGKIKDRRVQLCTDRYSYGDVLKVSSKLNSMGIDTKIVTRKAGVFRVGLHLETAQIFLENIFPYLVPSMYYKVNLCYDYKPRWMSDSYYKIMTSIQSAEH